MGQDRFPFFLSLFLLLLLAGVVPLLAEENNRATWEVESPAPVGSRQHSLSTSPGGSLLLSWVDEEAGDHLIKFAVFGEKGWSNPRTVARTANELAAPPQILTLDDGSLAAAWMTSAAFGGDRYAADIFIAKSEDGGLSWGDPIKPYSREARIYNAQMSMAALRNGALALLWTDSRQKDPARYQLKGVVVDGEGRPGDERTVDGEVCSCCETDTVAWGNELTTVYRDLLPGDVRDIALARWNGGGATVGRRVHEDNWVIPGCPSNGPAVDRRDADLTVAWFSAADGAGRVRVVFSDDRGESFGDPVEVDGNANGYVKTLILEDGSALVAWRGRAGAVEELRVAHVLPGGTVNNRTTLYRGGFPRWPSRHLSLARAGEHVFLAWTDPARKRVRVARIPLRALTQNSPASL